MKIGKENVEVCVLAIPTLYRQMFFLKLNNFHLRKENTDAFEAIFDKIASSKSIISASNFFANRLAYVGHLQCQVLCEWHRYFIKNWQTLIKMW